MHLSQNSMKILARPLTQLVFVATVIGVVSLILPQPSWADPASEANPLKDFGNQSTNDPFAVDTEQDSFGGIYDLMHRAQRGNIRSSDEFSTEQNQSLNEAAAGFRAKQRQLIQGQQQVSPVKPVSTPD